MKKNHYGLVATRRRAPVQLKLLRIMKLTFAFLFLCCMHVSAGVVSQTRVTLKLDKVNLKTKGFKMPFELSGGEQQRIDVARALLNSPKLILADEPTGNLDPETSDEIMQLLFHICRDYNTTIVMATHDYMVINKFPARTIKTESGKVWDNASISMT